MIRDPSDGSVRTPKEMESADSFSGHSDYTPVTVRSHTAPTSSGLPPITKNADQLARLDKARDWLREFYAKKGSKNETAASNPCGTNAVEDEAKR